MEFITLTKENLETEHICCAISNNKDIQVRSKKAWLVERMDEGLVFIKANDRGKCFIEYIPAEKAWAPIEAQGYTYIDCLWVSGQFKGHGYSSELLNKCIEDSKAKGKYGLVILSAKKKMPFLADPKFLQHKGFKAVDEAEPFYSLYALPFDSTAKEPKFKERVKKPQVDEQGFVLYYANQCPFTAKYVPLLEKTAADKGAPFISHYIQSCEEAQNAPAPFTSFTLFYNGSFICNEILSEKKFAQMIDELTQGGTK